TLTDTAVMVEAASVALLPGPVLPTVTASAVAMLSGDGPAARALLERFAGGATAAVILNGDSTFQASPAANGWTVSGSSVVTLGVRSAQVIVAAARA
ncbi:acyl-CoA dehydrogenase, partial [Mycobacterium sp. ITM-2017-0098]